MSVGIVGVDTFEVDTIQNRCDAQPGLHQFLAPGQLCLFVGHSKSIVVCLPSPHLHTTSFVRVALEVGNQRAWTPVSYAPIPVGRVGIIKVGGHLDAPQTKQISKESM